jgi:hypothetical protein
MDAEKKIEMLSERVRHWMDRAELAEAQLCMANIGLENIYKEYLLTRKSVPSGMEDLGSLASKD